MPATLVVDLDETLCRTDTLHEALLSLAGTRPLVLAGLLPRLLGERAAFKRCVADQGIVPPATLIYDEAVLDLLRQARDRGQRTALVSAADHRQVTAVADHLGLFDEAFGTGAPETGGGNLKGEAKADFLGARYGSGGFAYVGDSASDLAIWPRSQEGYAVRAASRVRRRLAATDLRVEHLDAPLSTRERLGYFFRAMRPHQWSKNLLVFLPALAAHDFMAVGTALIAFAAFCLIASSVYVVNDLIDLQADRAHPRKRLRPFAAGSLPIRDGAMLAGGLTIAALVLALLFTPPLFLGTLALYYIATFAYSLWLKRKLIVDILALSSLYTIRIIAGATATAVTLSPWMLAFSMFLFLSLAAVKRQAELTDQIDAGGPPLAGRAYRSDDLPIIVGIVLAAGYAAVLVFALYISSPTVSALYGMPDLLWLVCPLLLYWISRMVMMTHRGYMTDDPIVYAARDRVSQIVIVLAGLVVFTAALW